ncbi:uncharacterized protein LOC124458176 [Xenia sp. Carnegie-2017]|uniref:uncharacterized protein LOC124458176 n=1 Tax=Xenia sp. Carnegie-2017 TaxID=2897299 RepID=UPI001F04E612|nr:uncharacterized protein LOC124458176 [Xenia sp. Carnegie-2017]
MLRLLEKETCPLRENVLFEAFFSSADSCALKCLQEPFCVGFNFCEDIAIRDVTCQLTHTRPLNYEHCTDNKWSFYELLNPQRKIPYNKEKLCENGGITTVDLRDGPGSDPYRCQCSFGFTGENCMQKLYFSSCKEAVKDGRYSMPKT